MLLKKIYLYFLFLDIIFTSFNFGGALAITTVLTPSEFTKFYSGIVALEISVYTLV